MVAFGIQEWAAISNVLHLLYDFRSCFMWDNNQPNLYYAEINYTSATLGTALTNGLPAINFIMAVMFRMSSDWRNLALKVCQVKPKCLVWQFA